MALTTIALHVEPAALDALDADLALPLAIAEAHDAHVTAMVFVSGVGGEASRDEQVSLAQTGPVVLDEFVIEHLGATLKSRNLRFEVRGRSSFAYGVGEVFADQMRVSDIGMMSFAPVNDTSRRILAAGSLFSSGRPLILLPSGGTKVNTPLLSNIVLAWDASPAAVRAVHGALAFLKAAQTVTVVSVTDDKAFRPGQSGVELVRLLARHGANAEFRQVERGQGSVGDAILDAASDVGADMLVMGAVRHSPLHNVVFGSATKELFQLNPKITTLACA